MPMALLLTGKYIEINSLRMKILCISLQIKIGRGRGTPASYRTSVFRSSAVRPAGESEPLRESYLKALSHCRPNAGSEVGFRHDRPLRGTTSSRQLHGFFLRLEVGGAAGLP